MFNDDNHHGDHYEHYDYLLTGGDPVAGGVGCDQRGKVHQREEGCLQELHHDQGPWQIKIYPFTLWSSSKCTCDSHERDSGEHDAALGHGVDGHVLGADGLEELVELLLDAGGQHGAQVGDVRLAVVEVLQQFDAVTQPGEDGEFSFKRIFPENILFLGEL